MRKSAPKKPNYEWEEKFRYRMGMFKAASLLEDGGLAFSIKLHVTTGRFDRARSPNAYRMIDDYLRSHPSSDEHISFIEQHETGPELLVYLALGTAGITLAKSVIDLVSIIIKAHSKGIKSGDHPAAAVELIIRGFDENSELREETILRCAYHDYS